MAIEYPIPAPIQAPIQTPRSHMSEHKATITWSATDAPFEYDTYSRDHTWNFEDGLQFPASAAPTYLGSPGRVDPEEALVASISSCHMLTFLAIAARKRIAIRSYQDEAVGLLEKNDSGRLAITRVTLRPKIEFAGDPPSQEALRKLHDQSHQTCFIANSVTCAITVL